MRQLLDVPAPAKLNLFLHITGRRADGYHLLQSVFTLIDWCDTLHFDLRRDGRITREDLDPAMPLPDADLAVRAAQALQQHTGCPLGVHIGLHKSIPMQAGLGGGSSDAASTLLALNRLWRLGLDRSVLAQLGLSLGADVPFFVAGQSAWVEGVGEELTPLTLPAARYLVLKAAAGVATPAIFQHPALKRDTERVTIEDFVAEIGMIGACSRGEGPGKMEGKPKAGVAAALFGRNDLQPVAEALCPEITCSLEWLSQLGLLGRMTGSGSAVFAPVGSDTDTSGLPAGWIARHCNNLRAHPLYEWR